ncbi:MAG TPA: PQQ-binding-like beta-propeller repeat protein [Rhizomicrobium sp.]
MASLIYVYMRPIRFSLALLICAFSLASSLQAATEWDSWGNGPRFERFSPASQINRSNVAQLVPIWTFALAQHGAWEVTPIVVDGVMYLQDLQGAAYALDAETGRKLWRFESGVHAKIRAVSYWPGDGTHAPRIIMGVGDRIYALEIASGRPVPGFGGKQGYIDIREGFAAPDVPYRISSPPTIFGNLLITGPATAEFGSKGPPGDPRAYDVITGKLVWRFHIVPRPGEPNAGSWGPDGWKDRQGPGTWGFMSVDAALGMVYVPVAQPGDNYVGIDRPGDNLYSDSIVALDARTGTYRWHFQMVHHDLFDYDVAAAPALVDLMVKGRKIPALIEVTKQGLMFILDRRTGQPVFGVDEKPVPASTVAGERASPTQPFPRKPVPLAKLGVTRADITSVTPQAQRACADSWNRLGFHDSPVFMPPSLTGANLFAPSNIGGLGGVWGGVSVDPVRGTIFVNVTNQVGYNLLVPDDGRVKGPSSSGIVTQQAFTKWLDPNGMPCIQPPWGEMVAVDGNSGDVLWRSPLGAAEIYRDVGAHTGMINLGGSMATAGGLVFIGATSMGYGQGQYDDPVLRAYDSSTGLEIWRGRLPAGADASPMTFIGKSGRQYVVIATSGRPETDMALIAFALPRPGEKPVDIHPAPLPPSRLDEDASAQTPVRTVNRVEDLPPGQGRDMVLRVCTVCHSIGTVTGSARDRAGWINTVEEMRGRGAKADDATAQAIVDYLTVHFGRSVAR